MFFKWIICFERVNFGWNIFENFNNERYSLCFVCVVVFNGVNG